MGKKTGGRGKRSKGNKPSRVRYRASNKQVTNKIAKLEKQIKHLDKLATKNPESNINNSIEILKNRVKDLNSTSKGKNK